MSENNNISGNSGGQDQEFLKKTFFSAMFLTGFVLLMLASYGLWWAVSPLLVGMALSLFLLWSWDRLIRGLLTPDRIRAAKEKKSEMPKAALWVFALIKYPLVGLLLWTIARRWDTRQLLAFIGGFVLLHLVIALRALGAALTGNGESGTSIRKRGYIK